MGITALLVTESGEILDQAGDPMNHLHRLLPGPEDPAYVLVNFIDWYGDTIFNRLQMPRFVVEWARLRDAAVSIGAADLHSRVIAMTERCNAEVHVYLKFQGD
jgi:hypothetical protein